MAAKSNGKTKVKTKTARVNTRRKSKTTTTGSKNLSAEEKRIKKAPGAFISSKEYAPISKRTYELETRRKGSTKGYKKSGKKYYKASTIVK